MPFIEMSKRKAIQDGGLVELEDLKAGDFCYVFYKPMVDRWKARPSWTTAHEIYKDTIKQVNDVERFLNLDELAALELAWQVFFQIHVMPYELKKREENGDI